MPWVKIADGAVRGDNEQLGVFARAVADLGGHVHTAAKDCAHDGREACRACCPHDDDPRITEPEPSDSGWEWRSEWRDDARSSARVLVWSVAALVGAALVAALSALACAGVVPS